MISNSNCLSAATAKVFSACSMLLGVLCFKDPDENTNCKCTLANNTIWQKQFLFHGFIPMLLRFFSRFDAEFMFLSYKARENKRR